MVNVHIFNAISFHDRLWQKINIRIDNGIISSLDFVDPTEQREIIPFFLDKNQPRIVEDHGTTYINAEGYHLFPGFVDLHVHLREPGQVYKESIESGTMAAAAGGYTALCSMPNLDPIPDSLDHLQVQLERIRESARVHVFPYGAITKGQDGEELSEMREMAPYVCGFSDDGVGVQKEGLMEEAMVLAKDLSKAIVAHAEDESLVGGGIVHDGAFAKEHALPGNPSASEYVQVQRDLDLVRKTGVQYHLCHISTKESVAFIQQAQEKALPVSGETGPHYLTLNDTMLKDEGRFRMNPPIRSEEDQKALLQAFRQGSIAVLATDHAPHSKEEKEGRISESLNGIVGLETAFPVSYTHLVRTGFMELKDLIDRLTRGPVETLGLDHLWEAKESKGLGYKIEVGQVADVNLFDLNQKYRVNSENFYSKGKASPFDGDEVYGQCKLTLLGGEIVYEDL